MSLLLTAQRGVTVSVVSPRVKRTVLPLVSIPKAANATSWPGLIVVVGIESTPPSHGSPSALNTCRRTGRPGVLDTVMGTALLLRVPTLTFTLAAPLASPDGRRT